MNDEKNLNTKTFFFMHFKNLLLVLVIISFCFGVNSFEVKSSEKEFFTIEKEFAEPHIIENGEHIEIEVNGTNSYAIVPGMPILPYTIITFSFPFGTKIVDVKVIPSVIKKMKIRKGIIPAPPLIGLKKYEIKKDFDIFPNTFYEYILGGGIKNEKRLTFLILKVYPIRYKQNAIEYLQKVKVVLEVAVNNEKRTLKEDYKLLILCPEEFSNELQTLVEHKNNQNISTKLVTLSEIPMRGKDMQEDIKYFIKDAIENWGIKYVLLVGNENKFPVRYTHIAYKVGNDIIDDEAFISDLYYADIYDANGDFVSWDSNNNDIFGEYDWEGLYDDVDLFPDVYVGRLPCNDEDELKTVIDKIINYEEMKAYSQPWFTNVITVGGDTVPGDGRGIDEGEYIGQKILDIMDNFNGVKIWASNNKVKYAANINNAIESGAGFVSFSGHGSPTSWATHPHEKESVWLPIGGYKTSNVNVLSNSNKLPIVILNACSNSKFDETSNCIGWAFLANEKGGGIATIGNTALGWLYGGEHTINGLCGLMEYGTFKSYEGAKTFGMLWARTINNYIQTTGMDYALDYKTVEEWEPFGDPSLRISSPSSPPDKPEISGPTTVKKGVEYGYTIVSMDPDGDRIHYFIDWGDGNTQQIGPYESGEEINVSHIWNEKGGYEIKVKAIDEYGAQSDWATLPINVWKFPIIGFFLKLFLRFFL